MTQIQIDIGVRNSAPVHIRDTLSRSSDVSCCKCGERLVPVKGSVRAHHFRHYVPSECTGGSLHEQAIQAISTRARREIENGGSIPADAECSCGCSISIDILNLNGKAQKVVVEGLLRDFTASLHLHKPDVMLIAEPEVLCLEVVYTHPPSGILHEGYPVLQVPIEDSDAVAALACGAVKAGQLHNWACPHGEEAPLEDTPPRVQMPPAVTKRCSCGDGFWQHRHCDSCGARWPQRYPIPGKGLVIYDVTCACSGLGVEA